MAVKIKKILLVIMFVLTLFITVATAPKVYAGTAINQEVKKYHYEKNDIYYSDGYFAHPSTEYDEHLATLSVLMTKYSMNAYGPKNLNDTEYYQNQSNRVKGFFDLIGFDSFLPNDDYKKRTDFDTIGIAASKKQVGDYTLIGMAVRSGGYYREWANNIYLGDGTKSDYMHEGWYNAANKMIAHLKKYIEQYNITGKIKVWMAGFSRGGAVTNLTAGLLDNQIANNSLGFNNVTLAHDDLYAYTFEAPQGANINSKKVKNPSDAIYNNIFNVVNPNDLVTKVAMSAYGFTRFGIDKFITTQFYDKANFEKNRNVFKKLYAESYTDVNDYKADDFEMRGVTGDKIAGIVAGSVALGPVGGALTGYIISKVSGLTSKDTTKANYDSNIVTGIFLDELVRQIGSRENYCKTYQELAKQVMLALMSDDSFDEKVQFANLAANILINSMFAHFGINISGIIKQFYPDWSNTSLANLGAFIKLIAGIYVERPNELITLIMNVSNIFKNHDTDVNVVHLECQDSYYINAYNEKNPENKLERVKLRDNANLVHIAFFGYNDVKIYEPNGSKVVDVEGFVFGKSEVRKCSDNFAAGYYSYATEEKMELYLPVNNEYKVSFKSYSKKLRHLVTYDTYCQYISAHNNTATSKGGKLPSGKDKVWFNSDRIDITINVNP